MLERGIVCVVFCLQLFSINVQCHLLKAPNTDSSVHGNPLVVLISGGPHDNQHLYENDNQLRLGDEEENEVDAEDVKDEAKTVFLKYLMPSPAEDDDPQLKQHKNILRAALRSKCAAVNNCSSTCAKDSCEESEEDDCGQKCKKQCQEENDSNGMCERPKKECKRPKCGRTLPPSWRL